MKSTFCLKKKTTVVFKLLGIGGWCHLLFDWWGLKNIIKNNSFEIVFSTENSMPCYIFSKKHMKLCVLIDYKNLSYNDW